MISNHGSGRRLVFVDAARGIAMFFVFLSHFGYVYFTPAGGHTGELISAIGMLASPTFVLISGFLLGFMFSSRKEDFERFRERLIDRGIFLLLVAHPLILVAHLVVHLDWRWGFITDAIGVCMIAGALLIDRTRPAVRLVLSGLMFAGAWTVVALWHPVSPILRFLEDTLFGSTENHFYLYNFPIVPWFSLYFAASVLGERIAEWHAASDHRAVGRELRGFGLLGVTLGLGGTILAINLLGAEARIKPVQGRVHYVSQQGPSLDLSLESAEALADPGPGHLAVRISSPFQKLPPSPAYMLFYTGAGLLLLCGCWALERGGRLLPLLERASVIGRTSLFAFILQYYVYYFAFELLRLPVSPLWPAYFFASALAIAVVTTRWHDRGLNRYLTVGYPTWPCWKWMSGRAAASAARA